MSAAGWLQASASALYLLVSLLDLLPAPMLGSIAQGATERLS